MDQPKVQPKTVQAGTGSDDQVQIAKLPQKSPSIVLDDISFFP
jgi:hypothetical protein